jgi:CheY-like chemotaxis protein
MGGRQKNILVVDDVEDIREVLTQILQYEGYNVIAASNGKTAMEAIDGMRIDLVVTDILMPEMDGMELVNKIKESTPDTKFILMSAGGRYLPAKDYDYLEVAKKLTGASMVLKKPFEPTELIDIIGNMIG